MLFYIGLMLFFLCFMLYCSKTTKQGTCRWTKEFCTDEKMCQKVSRLLRKIGISAGISGAIMLFCWCWHMIGYPMPKVLAALAILVYSATLIWSVWQIALWTKGGQ